MPQISDTLAPINRNDTNEKTKREREGGREGKRESLIKRERES